MTNFNYFNTISSTELQSIDLEIKQFCLNKTIELIEILQPKNIIIFTSNIVELKKSGVKKIEQVGKYTKIGTLNDKKIIAIPHFSARGYNNSEIRNSIGREINEILRWKIILPKDVECIYSPFNYDDNIPTKWKEVALFNNLNIGIICVDGLCGAINLDGEIVIPIEYDNLIDFIELNSTHILAKKDEFWGYISWENKTLIPFEYSYASVFQNSKAKVCKNGRYYVINERNEILNELDKIT